MVDNLKDKLFGIIETNGYDETIAKVIERAYNCAAKGVTQYELVSALNCALRVHKFPTDIVVGVVATHGDEDEDGIVYSDGIWLEKAGKVIDVFPEIRFPNDSDNLGPIILDVNTYDMAGACEDDYWECKVDICYGMEWSNNLQPFGSYAMKNYMDTSFSDILSRKVSDKKSVKDLAAFLANVSEDTLQFRSCCRVTPRRVLIY